ncbi:unnamed protein product [Urochloa decumbens]|uniref:poly(A)-specific ribonuclease n=1 Tax=Urochloa decumbens TaxID=240449 RepID=A0ABC8W2Q2_9POAL
MATPWAILGRFVRVPSLPGGEEAEREARAEHAAAAAAGADAQALVPPEHLAEAEAEGVVAGDPLAEHAAAAAAAEPDFTFRVAPLPRVTVLTAGRGAHPDPESGDDHPCVVSASPSFLLVQFDGPIFFGSVAWSHLVVVRDFLTADGESTASAERVPLRTRPFPVVCNLEGLVIVPSGDGGCDGYTIAELQVQRRCDVATVIYLRSGPGEAEGWRARRVAYPLAAADRRWRPHGAVHVDDTIWWFDLTWGILSCAASLETRRVWPSTSSRTAAGSGRLRYVEIIGEGGGAARVCMWSRSRNPGGVGWRWDADYSVSFEEIWGDYSYKRTGLTRNVPLLVVVCPSDPHLVYFSLEQRIFAVNVLERRVLRNDPYELADVPGPARPASGRYVVAWDLPLPQAASQVIVPRGRTNMVPSSLPWWYDPQYQYFERLHSYLVDQSTTWVWQQQQQISPSVPLVWQQQMAQMLTSNVPLLPSGSGWRWAQPQRPEAVSFLQQRRLHVDSNDVKIIEVWKDTLQTAFSEITEILTSIRSDKCYLAFDTEFCIPDDVHPLPYEPPTPDAHYTQLQSYVHGGDLVQVGIGIADTEFNLLGGRVFQFNIRFDPSRRSLDHSGVQFLRNSGLKLEEHARRGLPAMELMAMIVELDLLMNKKVTWVTFNGYPDFGFMINLLTKDPLPQDRNEFLLQVGKYFPSSVDCKFLSKYGDCMEGRIPGKLDEVAAALGAKRSGKGHQAASDALLTLRCFRQLKALAPNFCEKSCGVLYGVCGCQDVLHKRTAVNCSL